MQNTRQIGAQYEEAAAHYLQKQGYQILKRNFRCRQGEIDIIARDGAYLCFVEVKYRRNARQGLGMEAVTGYKQRRISKAALYYLAGHAKPEESIRFDVLSIDGDQPYLIKNAFEFQG